MANEAKITDIVDKKSIDQLRVLEEKINAVAETYRAAAKEIGSGLNLKVEGIADYATKLQQLTAAIEKTVVGDKMLAEVKKEQEQLLKNINQQVKENIKQQLEQSKADKMAEQAALVADKRATERLRQEKLLGGQRKQSIVTEAEYTAILNTQAKSIEQATEQNKRLRLAVRQVTDEQDADGKLRQKLNGQINENTNYIKRNSDAFVKQKMTIGDYKEQVKSAMIELKNGENGFKNIGIVAKGFGGILKESVAPAVNEVKTGVVTMIKGWVGAQAVMAGIQQLVGLFKSGVGAAIDFEAANSKLAAILGTTSKNMKELVSDAKRLGSETRYTAAEATGLQIELAKLGFSKKEILESTEYILRFAQATGSELPEAAALAGAALRMFGADTTETERYVSAMAVATTKSALSFSYLQTAMPIAGSVAKTYGFEIEEVLALLGTLADAGIDASSAATATRNIFLNLANDTGKLSKAMGGEIKTLDDFVRGLKNVKDGGVELAEMLELTDKRSVNAFASFVRQSDSLAGLKASITGVEAELKTMAETMEDNVQGSLDNLSSAWEGFMITLMGSKGAMRDGIDWLSNLVNGMREAISTAEELSEERLAKAKKAGEQSAKEDKTFLASRAEAIDKQALYYRKMGVDGEKAFEDARNIQVAALEKSLKQEETLLIIYTKRNESLWGEYNNASGLKQGLGMQKSNNAMKKDISDSFKLAELQTKLIAEQKVQLEKVKDLKNDYKEDPKDVAAAKALSDKEKAEAEKLNRQLSQAASERLKIREAAQQSELNLMDEGSEKELKKIALNYNKQIAAVKGNSSDEVNTRKNLAEQMQRELSQYAISYNIQREKANIDARLEAVKAGSDKELELRLRSLDLQREMEINEAEKTGVDVFSIDEKYNVKRTELYEKQANERSKKVQNSYAMRSVIMNQSMQEELSILAKSYTDGVINEEAFERKKLEITSRYSIEQLKVALELAKQQLAISNLSAEDREAMARKVAEAEIALSNAVREAEVANAKKSADANKEKMRKVMESVQAAADLLDSFASLGSALFDRKIQEVEEEQAANDEAGAKEIERIEKLEETGAITTEEAEARKRAAEEKTAIRQKALAKQKADLQTKQAKLDKANSIVQAIIATALGVAKALPNLVLAALVGVMGAVQLATIVAQPIPKYAKGIDSHPGGPAIVGDGGKHEAVVIGSKYFITPNTDTLMDLPRGARVIPNIDKEMEDLRRIAVLSDVMLLNNTKREDGSRVTVNNDYSDLKKEMQLTNKLLSGMGKNRKSMQNYQSFNDYISRKI